MQYRKFGKLDLKVSALGFGCMRLPTLDGGQLSGNIDETEAIRMIHYAMDQGVNYLDTAYGYHGGNSEVITGKALQRGYRDRAYLATKSPTWLIERAEDFDRRLDEQLKKLRTEHIDFYLFHSLSKDWWRNIILKLNILERAEAAKQAGKIKYIGFSFHDDFAGFKEIVDGYDKWDFCQIQYNYMDIRNQAGKEGLKYAASKGIGVIVMEPLLGGRLANPPKSVMSIFKQQAVKRSPAEWALQWLWNQPEVSLVLSGMSNMRQVEENIRAAGASGINSLGEEELPIFDQIREKYNERTVIPCTGCNYCMPCPNNVNIPRNFELYNTGAIHNDIEGSRITYNNFFDEVNRAGACIRCRTCEEKCPQKIKIGEWMRKVHAVLGERVRN